MGKKEDKQACKALSSLIDKMSRIRYDEFVPEHRHQYLHPSSFPYCGLRHALSVRANGEPDYSEEDYSSRYFKENGHLIHEIIQEGLGLESVDDVYILGNWKCKGCRQEWKFCRQPFCQDCQKYAGYEELKITYKKITGHMDGILAVVIDGYTHYYLIDYKSTSGGVIFKNSKEGILPFSKNVHQIETYCVLAEYVYGLEVSGWFLVYAARDNPFRMFHVSPPPKPLDEKRKKTIRKRINKYNRHFKQARHADREDMETLLDEKPCKSYEHYMQTMHDPFDPCPHAENGNCFAENNKERMLKLFDIAEETNEGNN